MPADSAKTDELNTAPMISFVAPSGTGKTTLLANVISRLTDRGHRVGAVKHDAHRIELDTEGKDSWRLRQAGASTLLMGRDQLAFFGEDGSLPTLHQVAPLLFPNVDLILVEGFRSADLPTIMVTRPEHVDPTWQPPAQQRVFLTVSPDQVEVVVAALERRYLSHREQLK